MGVNTIGEVMVYLRQRWTGPPRRPLITDLRLDKKTIRTNYYDD